MGQNENAEFEIDLRTAFKFLLKWKKLVVGATILGIIIAGIMIAVSDHYGAPSFDATSVIKLGVLHPGTFYPTYKPQSYMDEIRDSLLDKREVATIIKKSGSNIDPQKLKKHLSLSFKKEYDFDLLEVSVKSTSQNEAEIICNESKEAIIRFINDKISKRLLGTQEELKRVKENIRRLKYGLREAESSLRNRAKPNSLSPEYVIRDEIQVNWILLDYKNKLNDLELRENQLSEILKAAEVHEVKPVRVIVSKDNLMRKWLPPIIVLGLLGFISGLCIAYFYANWREILDKIRLKISSKNQ